MKYLASSIVVCVTVFLAGSNLAAGAGAPPPPSRVMPDSTSTTTTAVHTESRACGDPVNARAGAPRVINTTDALFTLRVAVGAQVCAQCICDVNGTGDITASDALHILRLAIAIPMDLNCPRCPECAVTFGVTDADEFEALQFRVDYSGVGGEFVGSGPMPPAGDLACSWVTDGGSGVRDDETTSMMSVITARIVGPADVAVCRFAADVGALWPPIAEDFLIDTVSEVRLSSPPTTGGSNVCGAPVTGLSPPTAEDMYFVLGVSVGSGGACDACECDVIRDDRITGSDALAILAAAMGEPVTLACPPCTGPPGGTGGSTTAEVSISEITCQ